jgi:hypothetical protein
MQLEAQRRISKVFLAVRLPTWRQGGERPKRYAGKGVNDIEVTIGPEVMWVKRAFAGQWVMTCIPG